jgi:transcriptional regulator with XRE-family HTH domain
MPERNELNLRLAQLAKGRSLSEIAQRTGTSVANVSRYIRGTRIPGEFCSALVRELGVNPSWLLTGEGSPMLSDVADSTRRMAGDVLELVEAMNTVSRTRLGALTGKHHLRVLRDLNDALVRYEELRLRLNKNSAPIMRRLVEDLDSALARHDVDRAHELRKAAEQVERLCDEPELSRRFTAQQAHCEVLDQNTEAAIEFQRRLLRQAVSEGRLLSIDVAENFVRTALLTKDSGHLREALRICESAIALIDEDSANWQPCHAIRFLRGSFLFELGRLFEGIEAMQREVALVQGRRGKASRLTLQRALLMSGVLTLDEAYGYGYDAEPKALNLIEFALWTERPAEIRRALDYSRGDVDMLPGVLEPVVCAEHTLLALAGDPAAADAYIAALPSYINKGGAWALSNAATMLRLTGDGQRARKLARQADEMLQGQQPGIMLLARHYRNVQRLGMKGEVMQRGREFFAQHQAGGYRCFDAEVT